MNTAESIEPADVSVVIPAFNEAGRISRTIAGLRPYAGEVIVVDDASSDGTAQVAGESGAHVIVHSVNQGYIAAVKDGIREAHGRVVVLIDADGEFSPAFIPHLAVPVVAGEADMVQGRRPKPPRPSESFLSWLARLGGPVGDTGTGLRAIRADLAKTLRITGTCICGVLSLEVAALGGRIAEVPVSLEPVAKPRTIAWNHGIQIFYVLSALAKLAWARYIRRRKQQ